jgi:hypothetical protein
MPPTSTALYADDTKPYFLWWVDCTVRELRTHLVDPDLRRRGYWIAALLREANSRDVWLFVSADDIRRAWPHVVPHLGRSRAMWAWLLDMPAPSQPAPGDFGA